ncbi:MAG: hypothetical protein ABSF87_01915 [Xanthobacteraceae bacterium]|jgi:hypothetical protein
MTIGRAAAIFGFALVGWALCATSIGIGFAVTTQTVALIVHAIVAPVVFAGLSWIYFTRFAYTTPLMTAALFLGIVAALDLVIVAAFIVRSFAMFGSVLGTWLPFVLIFAATWATGIAVGRQGGTARP